MLSYTRKYKIKVNLIACCDKDYGIGLNNRIPWDNKSEMQFFRRVTINNIVIMGRKTYESLPQKSGLSDRLNIVITKNNYTKFGTPESVVFFQDIDSALDFISNLTVENCPKYYSQDVFAIGGKTIYTTFLKDYSGIIDTVYLNQIHLKYECDKFFPIDLLQQNKQLKFMYKNVTNPCTIDSYTSNLYKNEYNLEEEAYLQLLEKTVNSGDQRIDRTGVGTLAIFGERLQFDLTKHFPLLTTKKVPWKTVLRELLWFLSGSTDANLLKEQKVHIWDGNSSREFLDSRGLTNLPEGDIGSGYGHQWRHFGAEYKTCFDDYTGQGVDQISLVIDLIKKNPTSRRILFSAWNPSQQDTMALPPCHVMAQFFVREGKYLDCQLYQRSADLGLGIPFNIASYAFLTYMIAHVTHLTPGIFTHITGDTHVYLNHVEPLKKQLHRTPLEFPKLEITRQVDNIFSFKEEDFKITDYNHYPGIKMKMAV